MHFLTRGSLLLLLLGSPLSAHRSGQDKSTSSISVTGEGKIAVEVDNETSNSVDDDEVEFSVDSDGHDEEEFETGVEANDETANSIDDDEVEFSVDSISHDEEVSERPSKGGNSFVKTLVMTNFFGYILSWKSVTPPAFFTEMLATPLPNGVVPVYLDANKTVSKATPDPSYKAMPSGCFGNAVHLKRGTGDGTTWRCNSGACIEERGLCNGVKNCADDSDEAKCRIKAYKFTLTSLRLYMAQIQEMSKATEELVIGNGNTRMGKDQERNLLDLVDYLLTNAVLKRSLRVRTYRNKRKSSGTVSVPESVTIYVEDKPTNGWQALSWVTGMAQKFGDRTPYDLLVDLGSGGKFKPEASLKGGLGQTLMATVEKITKKYEFTQDNAAVFEGLLKENPKVWVGCTGEPQGRSKLASDYAAWLESTYGEKYPAAVKRWTFVPVNQEEEGSLEAKASANFVRIPSHMRTQGYGVLGMGGTTTQYVVMKGDTKQGSIGLEVAGKTLSKAGGYDKYLQAFTAAPWSSIRVWMVYP